MWSKSFHHMVWPRSSELYLSSSRRLSMFSTAIKPYFQNKIQNLQTDLDYFVWFVYKSRVKMILWFSKNWKRTSFSIAAHARRAMAKSALYQRFCYEILLPSTSTGCYFWELPSENHERIICGEKRTQNGFKIEEKRSNDTCHARSRNFLCMHDDNILQFNETETTI